MPTDTTTLHERGLLAADDAFGSLERLFRTAELAGHDPDQVSGRDRCRWRTRDGAGPAEITGALPVRSLIGYAAGTRVVVRRIRCAKDTGLDHFPSRTLAVNPARLDMVMLAGASRATISREPHRGIYAVNVSHFHNLFV